MGYSSRLVAQRVPRLVSLKTPKGGNMPENWIDKSKRWIAQITELGLLLVALAIVAQILVGETNLWVFDGVVDNLLVIIDRLGQNGLVGLVAIAIIMWLFAKRSPG